METVRAADGVRLLFCGADGSRRDSSSAVCSVVSRALSAACWELPTTTAPSCPPLFFTPLHGIIRYIIGGIGDPTQCLAESLEYLFAHYVICARLAAQQHRDTTNVREFSTPTT